MHCLRFGLCTGAVLGLISVLHGIFPLLLISSACMGMARAGTQMSRFVVGEIFPIDKRAQMIGRIVFAGTIGAIFGPALVEPSSQLAKFLSLELVTGPPLLGAPLAQLLLPSGGVAQELTTGPWVVALFLSGISFLITFALLRPEPAIVAQQYSEPHIEDAKPGASHQSGRIAAPAKCATGDPFDGDLPVGYEHLDDDNPLAYAPGGSFKRDGLDGDRSACFGHVRLVAA